VNASLKVNDQVIINPQAYYTGWLNPRAVLGMSAQYNLQDAGISR